MNLGWKGAAGVPCLFALTLAGTWAAEDTLFSVGLRSGFSASSFNDTFYQTDVFGSWDLPKHCPWYSESSGGWYVQTRVIGSAGWLVGQNEGGFVGTLGMSAIGGQRDFPLYLELGCSPTLLSRDEFGREDFGIPFQFTSHVGFNLNLNHRVVVGYRLQHMSNASITAENTGLNLHMIGISYRF